MTNQQAWMPSREHALRLEFGSIAYAERQVTISEACDELNALEADLETARGLLERMRLLALGDAGGWDAWLAGSRPTWREASE